MIAVIGAGVAGTACARALFDAGLDVAVFDQGRAAGGRAAALRAPTGIRYDHGAQFFTAKTPEFQAQVEQWLARGVISPWNARFADLDGGLVALRSARDEPRRYVGVPGMDSVAFDLLGAVDFRPGVAVSGVWGEPGAWTIEDSRGAALGVFDAVVSATPAPQTAQLLRQAAPALAERSGGVPMTACWAVLTAFREPLELPYDAAFVSGGPLSWIARDSSKPGRETDLDAWVLHASPKWSEEHVDAPAADIMRLLLTAFGERTGLGAPTPREAWAHRWRYATPPQPLPQACLLDADLRVGACGDWCGGPRVEGAWLSGVALARQMIEGLSA
ncbi:MAG: NAD(P)-binding protein [Acidobacteria bacterium]|nr:NAD(P)-binding protein [Acidobacteriota bacterium]